jgi:DNA-binding IclR family transcriptional regulator
MAISASGPAQSMPSELFMREVRPKLLATVREIERQFRNHD